MVHVELRHSSVFLHEPEAAAYVDAHKRLDRIACSVIETRRILGRLVESVSAHLAAR
ncbi:hypothetical protein [Actinokineospora sp. NPDC004072]